MPIKPTDVKILSAQIADTLYTKVVVDSIKYMSADATGINYQSTEPEDIVIDYDPKNRIVHDIAEIVQTFAWNVHKELEDSVDVPDHSAWDLSKDAAHDIVEVIEFYAASVNKVLQDTASVEQLVRLILTKEFDDYLVTTDAYRLDTELGKYDAVVTQDAFSRVVSFVRHFQDYLSVDDFAGIDKYFTGVKTNVAGAIDHSDYAFVKTLKDTSIASDITQLLTTKNFYDFVNIPDEYLFQLEKVFNDSTAAVDHRIASFLKVIADSVTVPDHYVADFTKVRADSASAVDSFSKVTEFIRSPNDLVTFEENTTFVSNKVLNDYPLSIDRNRSIMTKPLFDTVSSSDLILLSHALAKADTVSLPDAVKYSANKVLTDASNILDALVFISSLVYADVVLALDNVTLSSVKPFEDTTSFLDDYNIALVKDVSDTSAATDTLNYSLNAVYTDTITAITDVSKISKLKSVSDTMNTSDSMTRTVLYSRSFFDAVVLDDFMSTEGIVGASKFNAASAIDRLATSTNKVLENPCFVVDTPAIIYTKYALDTIGTQDSYVLSGVKGINEVLPITDTINIVAIIGTTSIFNAFAFNTSTFG